MSESEEKGVTILDAVRRAKEVSQVVVTMSKVLLAHGHVTLGAMVYRK